jgi:hypothetical protein
MYTVMAEVITDAVDELLQPFSSIRDPVQFLESTTAEGFFRDFLIRADRFADKCCHEFAKTLRESSVLTDIRGTPTAELAKQIRGSAFEKLDAILRSYVSALHALNFDTGTVAGLLSNSSIIDSALGAAAIGRVAGDHQLARELEGALHVKFVEVRKALLRADNHWDTKHVDGRSAAVNSGSEIGQNSRI